MAPVNATMASAIDDGEMTVAEMKAAAAARGANTGERRRSSVATEKVKLNSGHYIPQVALGVYKAPNDGTTENAVKWAFEAGYRHVDSGECLGVLGSFLLAAGAFGRPRGLFLRSSARFATHTWPSSDAR